MGRLISNDVTKLLVFLAMTFVLAALLVPQLYNLGQFVAEVTAQKEINPLINSLGAHAREADYAHYFYRSLYLAALILLPFLLFSLTARKVTATQRGPWSFALPERAIAPNRGQPLRQPPHPWRQLFGGFAMGAVFLLATGALALLLNFFEWKGHSLLSATASALTTSLAVALLEETVFRGIILGIFLRSFRPSLAIFFTALLFATLHFMQPPEEVIMPHPESLLAGFAFLELTFQRLLSAPLLLQQFAPLFLVGILLGTTRYLTSSLWLPIGLHAGWTFAFILAQEVAQPLAIRTPWTSLIIGNNLAEGLLPLGALGVCALVIWAVYRQPDTYPTPEHSPSLEPSS